MAKASFPHLTKQVVYNLGGYGSIIHNNDLNKKWEMLTLVKLEKKRFFKSNDPYPKPFVIKLDDITDERICLETETVVLVEDFQNFKLDNISIEVGDEAAEGQGKASGCSVDSTVTLKNEHIKQEELADLFMRPNKIKVKLGFEKTLKMLEGEKLAFVKQRIYNSRAVNVKTTTPKSWFHRFIYWGVKGEKAEVTTYTVPKDKIFAYGLSEITLEGGVLTFSPESNIHVYVDSAESEEFEVDPSVLEPLADVPESTRVDLLKKLIEILEDTEALALLEDSVDQYRHGKHERPQSEAVASFIDLLDVSKASSDFTKAVHMLVRALQGLPDNTAVLLAKSDCETLNCIIQLVDGWKDRKAKLPESPPPPLQENGELHWVAKFLIAANNMGDLYKTWDITQIRPDGLVELLYTSVEGLRRMKAGVSP